MPLTTEQKTLAQEMLRSATSEAERQDALATIRGIGATDQELSALMPAPAQSSSLFSKPLDPEEELRAVAQGAIRGLTLGGYSGPKSLFGIRLEPDESKLQTVNLPFFGESSLGRAAGELGSMFIPVIGGLKLAGRVGRAILPGVPEGLQFLAGSMVPRAAGVGAEVGTKLFGGEKVDWGKVAEDEAVNLAVGVAMMGTAAGLKKGGPVAYRSFRGWMNKVPDEGLEKIAKGLEKQAISKITRAGEISFFPSSEDVPKIESPLGGLPEVQRFPHTDFEERLAISQQRQSRMDLLKIPEKLARYIDRLTEKTEFTSDQLLGRAMMFKEEGKELTQENIQKGLRWLNADAEEKRRLLELALKPKIAAQEAAILKQREDLLSTVRGEKTPFPALPAPRTGPEGSAAMLRMKEAGETAPYILDTMGKYRKAAAEASWLPQEAVAPEIPSIGRLPIPSPARALEESGKQREEEMKKYLNERLTALRLVKKNLPSAKAPLEEKSKRITDFVLEGREKDREFVRRIDADIKAGMPIPKSVMRVYEDAIRRLRTLEGELPYIGKE